MKTPVLKPANAGHASRMFAAMKTMRDKSPAPQVRLSDLDTMAMHLVRARRNGKLYVYGDFGILFDVGAPWYSKQQALIEELIIRFRDTHGNKVESAIAQLDVLAKQLDCVAVVAGDTQIGYMAPRYLAAGFGFLGTQFYKPL